VNRRHVAAAWGIAYVLWVITLAFALTAAVNAGQVHWHQAGASTFGGPCEPAEHTGYRGDNLPTRWRSFAELNMGTSLGGLPYKTSIRVLNPSTHRRLTIHKRDIGRGGGPILRLPRLIDLYWGVTHYLDPRALCASWTGRILWRLYP
jgi:hypothetical protein